MKVNTVGFQDKCKYITFVIALYNFLFKYNDNVELTYNIIFHHQYPIVYSSANDPPTGEDLQLESEYLLPNLWDHLLSHVFLPQ